MSNFKIIKDARGKDRLLNIDNVCRVTEGEVQSSDGKYFMAHNSSLIYLAGFFSSGFLNETDYDYHLSLMEGGQDDDSV